MKDKFNIQHNGPVIGQCIGDNQVVVQNFNSIPHKRTCYYCEQEKDGAFLTPTTDSRLRGRIWVCNDCMESDNQMTTKSD